MVDLNMLWEAFLTCAWRGVEGCLALLLALGGALAVLNSGRQRPRCGRL